MLLVALFCIIRFPMIKERSAIALQPCCKDDRCMSGRAEGLKSRRGEEQIPYRINRIAAGLTYNWICSLGTGPISETSSASPEPLRIILLLFVLHYFIVEHQRTLIAVRIISLIFHMLSSSIEHQH